MRGTPWRLPYWPCESCPIDSPPSRSSLVSWSESNESATAQRAPPGQLFGRSGRPARTRLTMPRQRSSGHCQGRLLAHFLSILCARAVMNARLPSRTNRANSARRHAHALQALRVELLAHLGIGERLQRLGVDARNDLGRRAGGQPQPEPVDEVVVLEARFLHRRHVGQPFPALRAGEREHAHLARLHLRCGDLGADEEHVDARRDQVGHRLRDALVRARATMSVPLIDFITSAGMWLAVPMPAEA